MSHLNRESVLNQAPEAKEAYRSDPLDLILEAVWYRQQRSKLHAHSCSVCGRLRPCCQDPCRFRATDEERGWTCGCTANQEKQG